MAEKFGEMGVDEVLNNEDGSLEEILTDRIIKFYPARGEGPSTSTQSALETQ